MAVSLACISVDRDFRVVRVAGVKGENYIENTINVHRFSFLAKKSLHTLKVRSRCGARLYL